MHIQLWQYHAGFSANEYELPYKNEVCSLWEALVTDFYVSTDDVWRNLCTLKFCVHRKKIDGRKFSRCIKTLVYGYLTDQISNSFLKTSLINYMIVDMKNSTKKILKCSIKSWFGWILRKKWVKWCTRTATINIHLKYDVLCKYDANVCLSPFLSLSFFLLFILENREDIDFFW